MAIRIRDVNFGYGEKLVLRNISLQIPEGKFTVIIGKNGSGKSTLLKLMGGLLDPRRGFIEILRRDLKTLSIRARARLIGFLSQIHQPVFPFLVEDVVLTGRASYVFSVPDTLDRQEARNAMSLLGITELGKRHYNELSSGERQLVMVARVLAQKPKVILLDEPTSHLDLPNQARLLKIVKDLVISGLTVVAVLHDPSMAFLYGDNFVFLKHGEIRRPVDERDPYDSEMLSDVYETKVEVAHGDGKRWIVPAL